MKCFYINLANQTQRREAIETSFANCNSAGWQLERVEAVNTEQVQAMQVLGRITEREKACFLSHKLALLQALSSDEHVMIVEDDTRFSAHTFELINESLLAMPTPWEMLFTDVCIYETPAIARLIALRKAFDQTRTVQLHPLKEWPFAAASAYIIHKDSKRKLFDYLDTPTLDFQIDLLYRSLIHQSLVEAQMYFPFITTLSGHADASQIQHAATSLTGLTWNTFRRLVWLDRSLVECQPDLQAIQAQLLDGQANAYATVLAATLSDQFTPM